MTLFFSCDSDKLSPEEQFEKDVQLIEEYLAKNNLTAEKTVHGVYYVIDEPGSDKKPIITNTIVLNYKGYYVDDVEFDAGTRATFPLVQLIQGWQIGIPKFGIGGKGKLLIPSKYGYGSTPPGNIRANAVLIFDIELLDFN